LDKGQIYNNWLLLNRITAGAWTKWKYQWSTKI